MGWYSAQQISPMYVAKCKKKKTREKIFIAQPNQFK